MKFVEVVFQREGSICPGRCDSVGWSVILEPKSGALIPGQGTYRPCGCHPAAPCRNPGLGAQDRQPINASLTSVFLSFPSPFSKSNGEKKVNLHKLNLTLV